jgi:2-dehydropantoate 2-reductase
VELSIVGAGAIGLNLGARLGRAGCEVLFVVLRPEVARAIEGDGVRITDPATGEHRQSAARAVVGPASAAARLERGPVLLCVRANQTESLAVSLARCAPNATLVSTQNDVDNEAKLALHFSSVIGMAVRQTCTLESDNVVRASGSGRVILGRHPRGTDAEVRELAQALERAGFDVGLSQEIAEDKWLKLCVNLTSPANALIRRQDHRSRAFVEIKARLLEEARAALDAAGIVARSCDGRDRSLDEEIRHQRSSLELGTSLRTLPLYNAVWAALRHQGKSLEADRYHQRIIDIARQHGTPATTHETMLRALLHAWKQRLGPECYGAEELLPGGA